MEYVEERKGGYYVAGTRISLDSVVYEFNRGAAPETIFRAFPSIGSLERLYGAITWYLGNKSVVDASLVRHEQEFCNARDLQQLPPGLKKRVLEIRAELHQARH